MKERIGSRKEREQMMVEVEAFTIVRMRGESAWGEEVEEGCFLVVSLEVREEVRSGVVEVERSDEDRTIPMRDVSSNMQPMETGFWGWGFLVVMEEMDALGFAGVVVFEASVIGDDRRDL